MPKLAIHRAHGTTFDDAKTRVKTLVSEFQQSYAKYVDTVDWKGDGSGATAHGKGFTATFAVTDREVRVDVDLSFLLSPLKTRVETTVHSKLDATFGAR